MKYYTIALKNLAKPLKDNDTVKAATVEETGRHLIFKDEAGKEMARYDADSVVMWRELPD